MAIAFVRIKSVEGGIRQSSYPSNTAGNLLVVGASISGGGSTLSNPPTDGAGNTYVQVQTNTDNNVVYEMNISYAKNCVASVGSNTVTVGPAITGYAYIHLAEYSGADTTAPLRTSNNASGSSTTPNAGALSGLTAGDLVVGWMMTRGVVAITAGTGYTSRYDTSPLSRGVFEDKLAASSSETPDGTMTSDAWRGVSAAFIPAASGATAVTGFFHM